MGKHHRACQCCQCSNHHNQRQKPQTEVPSHNHPLSFLSKTVVAFISKYPAELIIEFISTIKAFDTTHAADASFTPAINAFRRILYFLWAEAQDKIPVIVSVPQSDGLAKQFLNDLTEKHIISHNIAPPNPNNVAGPSDATLNSLSGNIHFLTTRMET